MTSASLADREALSAPPAGEVRYPVRPSPVDAAVELVSVEASRAADGNGGVLTAVTAVEVEESEPVFEGHYPGFPIFPGVCIVECVRRSALALAERCGLPEPRLLAVESGRFLGSVRPGDRLTVSLDLSDHEGALRCRAKVSTVRGNVASVRLRFSGEVSV